MVAGRNGLGADPVFMRNNHHYGNMSPNNMLDRKWKSKFFM